MLHPETKTFERDFDGRNQGRDYGEKKNLNTNLKTDKIWKHILETLDCQDSEASK